MGKGRGQSRNGRLREVDTQPRATAVPVVDRACPRALEGLAPRLTTGTFHLQADGLGSYAVRQVAARAARPYFEFDLDLLRPDSLDRFERALDEQGAVVVLRGVCTGDPTPALTALGAAPRATVVFLDEAGARQFNVEGQIILDAGEGALRQLLAAKLRARGVDPDPARLDDSIALFHRLEEAYTAGRLAKRPDVSELVAHAYWSHRAGPEQAQAALGRVAGPEVLSGLVQPAGA